MPRRNEYSNIYKRFDKWLNGESEQPKSLREYLKKVSEWQKYTTTVAQAQFWREQYKVKELDLDAMGLFRRILKDGETRFYDKKTKRRKNIEW